MSISCLRRLPASAAQLLPVATPAHWAERLQKQSSRSEVCSWLCRRHKTLAIGERAPTSIYIYIYIYIMWKFKSAWDSDGHPLLHSLNGNIGRQTWVFDASAGTDEEKEAVERLRETFTRNRHSQKHSSDELLR